MAIGCFYRYDSIVYELRLWDIHELRVKTAASASPLKSHDANMLHP